jgi:hypothetical protein
MIRRLINKLHGRSPKHRRAANVDVKEREHRYEVANDASQLGPRI